MWRRFGDLGFAALVAVLITAEAVPLVWLTWVVLGDLGHHEGLTWILLGGVATAALGLVVVTAYLLAYQTVSDRRPAALARARGEWVARWLQALEDLARARAPEAMPTLLAAVIDPQPPGAGGGGEGGRADPGGRRGPRGAGGARRRRSRRASSPGPFPSG
ncbi:MAG: hypothetical protein KatS3mg014_0781 [Actinomycetota bacterium]|nr:MAG: hypothetical protein KatS3mg014_0781 [Actinomycetota bacterium]